MTSLFHTSTDPPEGTFSWISSQSSTQKEYSIVYTILTEHHLWDWIRENSLPSPSRYLQLLPTCPELQTIRTEWTEKRGGNPPPPFEFETVLRAMHQIATKGWAAYVKETLKTSADPPHNTPSWGEAVRRKAIEVYGYDSPYTENMVLNLVNQ